MKLYPIFKESIHVNAIIRIIGDIIRDYHRNRNRSKDAMASKGKSGRSRNIILSYNLMNDEDSSKMDGDEDIW